MTRSASALLCALVLAACSHPAGLVPSPLEDAARRVSGGNHDPREQALAAFAAWLLRSNPKEAAPLFAASGKAGDPWGLYGEAELARRSLDVRAQASAYLRLCKAAPRHALCAVAARHLGYLVGESLALDQTLDAGIQELLAAKPGPEAAHLLRLAAATLRRNQGDDAGSAAKCAEAGRMGAATLLGPYSRYHFLEWDTAFPPEQGDVAGGTVGPHGKVAPREVRSPCGRFNLSAEPTVADVSYWVADVELPEAGAYQVHVSSSGTWRLLVDGTRVLDQRDFEGWPATERAAGLRLSAGRHRVVVKTSRGTERSDDGFTLALLRADGGPSRLAWSPARGAAPAGTVVVLPQADARTDANSLAAALEAEVGGLLAGYAAARSSADRDPEGTLELADSLVAQRASAPFLVARAEALLLNRSLPSRLARGRANRDLEEALKLDPAEASGLQRLSIHARGESRFDDAAELLARAREAAGPSSYRVLLSEMRLAQQRGVDSLADELATRALALEAGLCDAMELRYEQARRFDAVALADRLIQEHTGCPGHAARLAEHLRVRGDLAGARAQLEALAAANPLDPNPRQAVAQLALAQGKPQEAAAIFEALERAWPRAATWPKRRAEALERAGDLAGARAAKEAALLLDGSDLKLRRALAIEDGREVLDELKVDAAALRQRWEARHGAERPTASGVYILDGYALEAHPDGSLTERTHQLAKVLNQEGVSALAEVHLPAGAEVLTLRTIKADGRVLEPEAIGGKDGISLPGVEVGDYVEYEFLHATPSRGAALPGFVSPRFYFRIADGQLFHSTWAARAPAGLGLEVDAHNLPAPELKREGNYDVVRVALEEMPTFVREPGGPSGEEVLPFVQAGTGAGAEETVANLADFVLDKSRPTAEVVRFAREAAGAKLGREAVEAVWAAVMQRVKGPEANLATTAAATLAQERGSRLMLLRSALGVLGIPSRLLFVRPFHADPAPYRFPGGEQFAYAALQIRLPEGELLAAPGVRFAPLGRLAPQAEGQPGFVLPQVGEKPRALTTAGTREADGKRTTLKLALAEDGTLSGRGEERLDGLEAAYLRTNLERMNESQRRQAIEASIARTFDNGSLTDFRIEDDERPGAPVIIHYGFHAPGFARAEGGRLIVSRGLDPAQRSRRFLQLFERKTPLVVGNPEHLQMEVELTLPAGFLLKDGPVATRLQTAFGRFEREEHSAPGSFRFKQDSTLAMIRVKPEDYRAFAEFLLSADKAEQRELVFERVQLQAAR